MKKVIVAAAGLMLVGTMASTAMAEFKFSGDARVRYFLQDSYGDVIPDETDVHWSSRTRFKIEADTKGGAYVKTRIRLDDAKWGDNTSNGSGNGTGNKNNNIWTDYAYIGVPFGPVTVEGGRVIRDVTPFFFMDERADSIQAKYSNDMTKLVAFYDVTDENTDDDTDEDDFDMYGALLNQGFSGGWNLLVGGIYQNNEIADEDAFGATAQVTGTVGTVALAAELAYMEENFISGQTSNDLTGTSTGIADDDGFGGYVSATVPVGAVELLGLVGFTTDGYIIDHDDFGPFIMVGSYSQISTGFDWSSNGDSWFAGIAPTYKVSEQLTVGAQVSYVGLDPDDDTFGDDADDQDVFEIGATASYAVTDGASLSGIIGYADVDELNDEENPFGIGLELAIKF